MSQANLNFPPDFDKLNCHKLKSIAKRWAGEYPKGFIKRIDLYSYASPYQKALKGAIPTKYAIVFKIWPLFTPSKDEKTAEEEHYAKIFSLCEIYQVWGIIPHEKLTSATEQNFTVHQGYLDLIKADFLDVYKSEAKENFMDEWRFIIKEPGCTLPKAVKVNEPSINLFDFEPQSLEELIKKARPEIEILYKAIKAVGFSGRLVDPELKWKEAALTKFENNKSNFQCIKRYYLEDKSVYEFTEGKARRDFIGKILQKIISDKGLGPNNYSELFNIYSQLTDKSDNIST